ncbi:hypothetical protein ACSRUE_01520 [Sorangium sp. KYC3313]|uniref:hypothetical protein n=1 Tax=Sorangium sp. KYC3313 TaxID=3449740 RepID=UPI003F8902B4
MSSAIVVVALPLAAAVAWQVKGRRGRQPSRPATRTSEVHVVSRIRANVKAGKRRLVREREAPATVRSDIEDPDDALLAPCRDFRRLRSPRADRVAEVLSVKALVSKLIELAHAAGSPSADRLPVEPQITVHEILWAMQMALDRGDEKVLKDLHVRAVEYLRANAEWNFDYATTDVVTRGEFARWLVAAIERARDSEPDSMIEPVETHVRIGWMVLRGARVFPGIGAAGEDGVVRAMGREFGPDPVDLSDPKEIAMRALRAAGVSKKTVWNTFEAPERMKASRDRRRRKGPASGEPEG